MGSFLAWSCLVLVVSLYWVFVRKQEVLSTKFSSNQNISELPVFDCTGLNAGDLFQTAIAGKKPILFRNFPGITSSSEIFQWNIAELERILKQTVLVNALMSDRERFWYYDSRRPMSGLGQFRQPYQLVNATLRDLLTHRSTGRYVYFSHFLDDLNSELQQTADFLTRIFPIQTRPNLWLGSTNVTSHLHFDANNNWYLQVSGKKLWHLVSPQHWAELKMYPRPHPATRQSRLDLTGPVPASLEVQQVLLEPGDLLYIPGFHFHEVKAVTDSVSLSMYTPSEDKATTQEVWSVRPSLAARSRGEQQMRAQYFIQQLLRQRGLPIGFLKQVLSSRWLSFDNDPLLTETAHFQLRAASAGRPEFCTDDKLPSDVRHELEASADQLASHLGRLSPGVDALITADYIEELVSAVVQPQNLATFLRDCFALD